MVSVKHFTRAAASAAGSENRYRYFATPVIRAYSISSPQGSRQAHFAAVQKQYAPLHDTPPIRPVNYGLDLPKHALSVQPDPFDFDFNTLPPGEWMKRDHSQRNLAASSSKPSVLQERYTSPTNWRSWKTDRSRTTTWRESAAELPLLQEPDQLQDSEAPSYVRWDWRKTAVSQMDEEDVQAYFRIKRPQRRIINSGIPSDSPWRSTVDAYTNKFEPLVRAEQLASDAVLEERVTEWSLERLKEEGYCLTGLSGFWQEATHYGMPVAVFALGPGVKLPWLRFQTGDQIRLSNWTVGPNDPSHKSGTIIRLSETEIRVSFEERFSLEGRDAGPYDRMDLWASDIATRRMLEAMFSMHFDPLSQREGELEGSQGHQSILRGTELRDMLLRSTAATTTATATEHLPIADVDDLSGAFVQNQLITSWVKRHRHFDPISIPGDPHVPLNETQIKALSTMLGNRLSLIQGPPGTGKTRTIATAARLLKAHWKVPHPILICTYTNVAVDNLVEALVSEGLNPLRVGSVGKIKEGVASYSLEARMEKHCLYRDFKTSQAKLSDGEKKQKELRRKLETARTPKERESLETRIRRLEVNCDRLRRTAMRLRFAMTDEILHTADVICTTCITSVSSAMNLIDFPVVFLDEASMCTEPASLIPIMKGCQHLSLIGDHKQLPPIITSPDAMAGGLGISLFERLISEGGVPTIMLDRQYRMDPRISAFPAQEFYGGALLDGLTNDRGAGSAAQEMPMPIRSKYLTDEGSPVVFLDHVGPETRRDRSRINQLEADIVCQVIGDLLQQNPSLKGDDIGVIAPYAAQITLLGHHLRENSKFQAALGSKIGEHRALEVSAVEVKTVDGFEGREKEVIIFSTVRNNYSGYIGFLSDRRRLNVGLTRAKRALFVIGNKATLKAGKIGYVEGAGLQASGSGAGARNVKTDLGVDVAGRTKGDVLWKEHKPKDNVWRRYIDWLDTKKLIVSTRLSEARPDEDTEVDAAEIVS